jgi:hypothetical protein
MIYTYDAGIRISVTRDSEKFRLVVSTYASNIVLGILLSKITTLMSPWLMVKKFEADWIKSSMVSSSGRVEVVRRRGGMDREDTLVRDSHIHEG